MYNCEVMELGRVHNFSLVIVASIDPFLWKHDFLLPPVLRKPPEVVVIATEQTVELFSNVQVEVINY